MRLCTLLFSLYLQLEIAGKTKVCCSKQHVLLGLLFYSDIVVKKVWIENSARIQVLVCGIVWVSASIFAQDAEQGSSIRWVFIKSS